MTQTEKRRLINKAVYEFAATMGYEMEDGGDGSCVTFMKPDAAFDDSIDYSRSQRECYVLNWASQQAKDDADKIDAYAQELIRQSNDWID